MSKQESYHPDGEEATGQKSPVRKEKGEWELWKRRMRRYDHHKIWRIGSRSWKWAKRSSYWHVGSYLTKEQAEVVREKCRRDAGGTRYTYYVLGPDDPKPKQPPPGRGRWF